MKIAFVLDFKTEIAINGITNYVEQLTKSMAKEGHSMAIISYGDKTYQTKQNGIEYMYLRSAGLGEVAIPRVSLSDIMKLFNFLEEFDPDVIHVNTPAFIAYLTTIWGVRNKKINVYTLHILSTKYSEFAEMSKTFEFLLKTKIINRFVTSFYQNCDLIIAPNQKAADDLELFGFERQAVVVHNGYASEFNTAKYADISHKPLKLLYVGHISKRKNELFLIQAKKYLPADVELILIGSDRDEAYAAKLHEYINQNKIKNVVFKGRIAHDQIVKEYEAAHFLVSAAKREVQSLTVIEALASGTPVIGLSNETIDELIDDTNGRVMDVDILPEDFAMAVEQMANINQQQYLKLAQHARDRVKDYSWDQVAKKLVAEYNSISSKMAASPKQVRLVNRVFDAIADSQLKNYLQHFLPIQQKLKERPKARNLIFLGGALGIAFFGYKMIVAKKIFDDPEARYIDKKKSPKQSFDK